MTPDRILFVQPPLHLPSDFVDYPWFADLGLLFAAARASRAGWRAQVVDAFALPGAGRSREGEGWRLGVGEEDLLAAMPPEEPSVVVVGNSPFLRAWAPHPDTVGLLDALRRSWPRATLVLADADVGGMHAVDPPDGSVLEALPVLDGFLRWAGEAAFDDPRRLRDLKGSRAEVRMPAGDWEVPPPFPLWEALDRGHWSAFLWRCFEDGTWANPFRIDAGSRALLTSSGCPHRCLFCSSNPGWRETGRKVQRRVPLPVLRDWVMLARAMGARNLIVLDEMANLRPDFPEVLEVFGQADLRVEFPNGLRADRLPDDVLPALARRVSRLSVSAESASQEDLQGLIGKRQDLREVERVLQGAARLGLPTMVHFVVGFPWETPESVLATLDLAWRYYEELGAEPAVQFATPLRGTGLFEECLRRGLLPADGGLPGDGALFQHRPAFRPPSIPEGWLETAVQAFRRKVQASTTRKVIINVTYECINECEFCAVANRVRRPIPWPRLQEILRHHREAGIEHLDIDGGEPTLHPHLLEALRLARDLGYREINVTTNGRRLADPAVARALLDAGVTSVLVSLHGDVPEVHDGITGRPGSFRETLAGLRNLVRGRGSTLDLGVNVTVCRANVDRLLPLVERIREEGVDKVNLQMLTPFGSAGAQVLPEEGRAAAAIREVLDRHGASMRLFVVNAPFCLFPGYERFLVGDVGKIGRSMIFVTEETVNLFEYLSSRRVRREPCRVCPHAPACDGFFVFEEEDQHA
ncbi:MAG TPA: radical SAM protein [Myxococcota bacterium]|nr:radical SAM protein [Myxococcota bacterium]HQK52054.1 radical SAM protein [Myxococcota bacterium]